MRHNHASRPPAEDKDYEVGYGKPPQDSRFTSGRSGNPGGRPKGSPNLATLLAAAMNQKVTVTEQGKSRRITKVLAIVTQAVNRAAKGDLAAMKLLLHLEDRREANLRTAPHVDRGGREPQTPARSDSLDHLDFRKMSTKELEILMEAVWIIDGKKERPPIPMPPEDPGDKPDDPEDKKE